MRRLDAVSTELRERRLAGSTRAGSWARGRARRQQRAYLRRTWKPYATFLAACYLVAGLVCVWLPNDLTRGFVLGAAGVGAPALLWGLLVQMSGTAPTMMGDTAEQWTAGELKRSRSAGWRLVNHFALGRDDIDHLLLGPGGVYCVETKWSASPWAGQAGRDRVMRAVEQVSTNTRRLSNWQPFRKAGLRAQPLVVLWGGALAADDGLPAVRTVGPATVGAGHALRRWTRAFRQPASPLIRSPPCGRTSTARFSPATATRKKRRRWRGQPGTSSYSPSSRSSVVCCRSWFSMPCFIGPARYGGRSAELSSLPRSPLLLPGTTGRAGPPAGGSPDASRHWSRWRSSSS